MLADACVKYYDKKYDFNCAECMLYAANEEYNIRMSKDAFKLAAGFGGGMAVESVCGVMTGSIMVLGRLFVNDRAHESDRIKVLVKELVEEFNRELKSSNCCELKTLYRNDEKRCIDIVKACAEILDRIVRREMK